MKTKDDLNVAQPTQRHELGSFLRTRRKLLSPAELGLSIRRRRRRPGLSREDVAYLSGISADWYGRLEGGLDIAPSAATLLAVAEALRLDHVETEYVFTLANVYPPRSYELAEYRVPDAIRTLVLGTERVGLMMCDAYMTPRAWNRIADAMFNISPFATPLERNIIVRMADRYFLDYFRDDYDPVMRRVVGFFRRAFSAKPTLFAQRVYAIAQEYPQFREYWNDYVVADETTLGPGPHVRYHPIVGRFSFKAADLYPLRRQDMLRVVSPADEESAAKFERLRALGTPFE